VNYSTGKVKLTEGSMQDDKEQVRWQTLGDRRRWTLGSVGDGWAFNPLGDGG
jgi:hypothetical protein